MSANANGNRPWTSKKICLTAIMTVLVFFMTFVPKIPIPLGYAQVTAPPFQMGV